jgi:hypothetical protein
MMDLSRTVFIGIDISSGRRGFTYAALDLERHLMALCQGDLQEIVAYTAGQSAAFAAIGGPPRPNQGLLAGSEQQEGLFPLPQGKDAQMRLAEHELAQKGITPARTPASVSACPGWMRLGFELYHHLQTVGYQAFPCEDAPVSTWKRHPKPHTGRCWDWRLLRPRHWKAACSASCCCTNMACRCAIRFIFWKK